jgi:hypothetical protein
VVSSREDLSTREAPLEIVRAATLKDALKAVIK